MGNRWGVGVGGGGHPVWGLRTPFFVAPQNFEGGGVFNWPVGWGKTWGVGLANPRPLTWIPPSTTGPGDLDVRKISVRGKKEKKECLFADPGKIGRFGCFFSKRN